MQNDKWVVITGATSGIGLKYAEKLAGKGYNILMQGRREELLRRRAEEISATYNVKTEVVIAELSKDEEVEQLILSIKALPEITYLINNAGYGNNTHFLGDNFKDQWDLVKVHLEATCKLCHSVVPLMIPNGKGYVIQVSSLAAFTINPGAEFYGATKVFLNSFSQSLQAGLMGKGIKVQSLCPGFTHTDLHERLGIPARKLKSRGIIRWTDPGSVVDYSLRKLKSKKVVVIPGFWNRVIAVLVRMIPAGIYYKQAANLKRKFE